MQTRSDVDVACSEIYWDAEQLVIYWQVRSLYRVSFTVMNCDAKQAVSAVQRVLDDVVQLVWVYCEDVQMVQAEHTRSLVAVGAFDW